jgi:hypothetical protein
MDTLLDEEDARIEVVYQFNSNPKKNIAALCAYFKQDPTPPNIARLLRTTEGLLGDKIGDYLVRPENTEVLRAYFDDLDFKVDFVEAMRRGLSGPFFMPGEAQQVERTMQALCDAYMAQNPTRFGHPDDPVVLGYALVMLNTDMLKPNVKTKMTVAEFIDNTSRALEHSVFTPEELTALYNSLKATPFAFAPATNEFMAMSAPKISGYLRKKSVRFGAAWSTHFFVLANSCLYYFQDNAPENKDKILGMIQLVEVEISADHESPKRLKVTAKGEEIQYVKLGRGKPTLVPGVKVLLLEAQDEETRNKWLSRLKKSAIMLAFQDGSAGGSVEITSESANETV